MVANSQIWTRASKERRLGASNWQENWDRLLEKGDWKRDTKCFPAFKFLESYNDQVPPGFQFVETYFVFDVVSSKADPDLWMRSGKKANGDHIYEYVISYLGWPSWTSSHVTFRMQKFSCA